MSDASFKVLLYLPAQGAAETEATIVEWKVGPGDSFEKGQILADIESAKAVFEYEAPCAGTVIRLCLQAGENCPFSEPIMEIVTTDPEMKNWIAPAQASSQEVGDAAKGRPAHPNEKLSSGRLATCNEDLLILGVGGYLPKRIVRNQELLAGFEKMTDDYIFQVTGIRERRWAADGEKPSDMAYVAALEAIRKAAISIKDIDAIIVSTTTPDCAMPSTACILQDRLSLSNVPAFDLNAACSGFLYAVAMAEGMICAGLASHVLTVGTDLQSRMLDKTDRDTYFIFGDGAGAAIISSSKNGARSGHRIRNTILGTEAQGLNFARRSAPGFLIGNGCSQVDPWIRLDGRAMFRSATELFAALIRESAARSGWALDKTNWIVPHQANLRILKAAAKRSGVPYERFCVNIEKAGNTSSASIPLALLDIEGRLKPGDKMILCSVGAGVTTAAVSVEW